jgi:hypothetical protein
MRPTAETVAVGRTVNRSSLVVNGPGICRQDDIKGRPRWRLADPLGVMRGLRDCVQAVVLADEAGLATPGE